MKRPALILLAMLPLQAAPVAAQLAEAECASAWPGFPFPEGIFLENAQRTGLDPAARQFASPDVVRGGQPPSQPAMSNSSRWIWHADLAAISRTSDLGVFVSRFNESPGSRVRGGTDGYIVSAWAFVDKGSRKLIANTWLHAKNDRRPLRRSVESGLSVGCPEDYCRRRQLPTSAKLRRQLTHPLRCATQTMHSSRRLPAAAAGRPCSRLPAMTTACSSCPRWER